MDFEITFDFWSLYKSMTVAQKVIIDQWEPAKLADKIMQACQKYDDLNMNYEDILGEMFDGEAS